MIQVRLDIKEDNDEDKVINCPYCKFPNDKVNKECALCNRNINNIPKNFDKK